jgi:hypothetical protein
MKTFASNYPFRTCPDISGKLGGFFFALTLLAGLNATAFAESNNIRALHVPCDATGLYYSDPNWYSLTNPYAQIFSINPFILAGWNGVDSHYTINYGDTVRYTYCECFNEWPSSVPSKITVRHGGQFLNEVPPAYGACQFDLTNYWFGSTDEKWSTPDNWTADKAPADGDSIIFATYANYGADAAYDLYVDGNHRVNRIINAFGTNRKLVILTGASLTVTDSIKGFDESNLIIRAAKDSLNATLILPKNTKQRATVMLYSKAETEEEAKMSGAFKWQFITSPVREYPAKYMQGSWMRLYDETKTDGNYWVQLNNDSILRPFKGYEISHKETTNPSGISIFKGELVTNDTAIFVTWTPENDYTGGRLVTGNPYTAALDIQNGLFFDSNIEETVYLFHSGTSGEWDAKKGVEGMAAGQYLSVPKYRAGLDTLPATIASMQGFVVQHKCTLTTAPGLLTFEYSGVSRTNTDMRVKRRMIDPGADFVLPYVATVQLSAGETPKDKVWLFVEEGMTRGFDNGYDGRKMVGEKPSAMLYASETDGDYQVNSIPDINETFLSIEAEEGATEYSLTFNYKDRNTDEEILLFDTKTRELVNISADSSTYHFHASATDNGEKRFQIITRKAEIDSEDKEVRVLRIDGNTFIDSRSKNTAEIRLFDLGGRQLQQTLQLAPGEIKALPSLPGGVYVVGITVEGKKRYSEKVVM